MSPVLRPRPAARSAWPLPLHAACAGALGLLGAASFGGCTSTEPIGGCWAATLDGGRTVSFFVDTDDDSVLGAETTGEGDDAVRTDFEGRLESSGGDSYGIDASCSGGGGANGCEGVADWSLRCTLDEGGEEPVLRCSGAPFAGPTELTTCQGSATVPQ